MDIYLIKLMLAHLMGDFFLQPGSWVEDKKNKKLRSGKLYLHVAVHVLLIFIVFMQVNVWKTALTIGLFHLIIDALKSVFETDRNSRKLFFADQILHILSIIMVWQLFFKGHFPTDFLNETSFWIVVSGIAFLTMPASIIMRIIIAKWIPDSQPSGTKSLQNAGKYIGVLERLLIFLFILTSHFEAVGFLLAAKSIFRFGDLKESHDIKLTEYVLIGTLLSFGIAIGIGLVVKQLIA